MPACRLQAQGCSSIRSQENQYQITFLISITWLVSILNIINTESSLSTNLLFSRIFTSPFSFLISLITLCFFFSLSFSLSFSLILSLILSEKTKIFKTVEGGGSQWAGGQCGLHIKSRVARATQWHLITPKRQKNKNRNKINIIHTKTMMTGENLPFFFPFSVLGQISTFLSLSTQYRSKFITHLISMIIFHSFHVSQNAGLTQITENHRLSFLEQTRRLQSYSSETKHILLLTNTHPHRIIQGLHEDRNDYRELQAD